MSMARISGAAHSGILPVGVTTSSTVRMGPAWKGQLRALKERDAVSSKWGSAGKDPAFPTTREPMTMSARPATGLNPPQKPADKRMEGLSTKVRARATPSEPIPA